jgi:hypothetical protein
MQTSLNERVLTQLLDNLDLKKINEARQKMVNEGKEPNQAVREELEIEVHQIHDSKESRYSSKNIIRSNWLKFRAGCWRCLSFDHFGLGSTDRIVGQPEKSTYVSKKFMAHIVKFLFARDTDNAEIQKRRTELIHGII